MFFDRAAAEYRVLGAEDRRCEGAVCLQAMGSLHEQFGESELAAMKYHDAGRYYQQRKGSPTLALDAFMKASSLYSGNANLVKSVNKDIVKCVTELLRTTEDASLIRRWGQFLEVHGGEAELWVLATALLRAGQWSKALDTLQTLISTTSLEGSAKLPCYRSLALILAYGLASGWGCEGDTPGTKGDACDEADAAAEAEAEVKAKTTGGHGDGEDEDDSSVADVDFNTGFDLFSRVQRGFNKVGSWTSASARSAVYAYLRALEAQPGAETGALEPAAVAEARERVLRAVGAAEGGDIAAMLTWTEKQVSDACVRGPRRAQELREDVDGAAEKNAEIDLS
jgi:hypothetical protein